MITKEQLNAVATNKGIMAKNVEKEYMIDICLITISRHVKGFVFKGGTALYKFHGLNRFSEDIDFVQDSKKINFKKLSDQVILSSKSLGINARAGAIEKYQKELNFSISFNGPLYNGSKASTTRVSFNVSLREKPQHKVEKLCMSSFNEISSFYLWVLREDEILAEKIRTILTRDKPRDIYDTWFLLKKGVVLDEKLVNKKLKIYKMTLDINKVLENIEQMKGGWNRDLKALIIGELPRFDKVLEDIRDHIKKK